MTTLDPFEMTDIMNNLHTIRAHMLFYNSLLADFQKAVVFVKNTRNPALAGSANREQARGAIEKECNHILQGIGRIEKDCQMQDMRLKNATNLVRVIIANVHRPRLHCTAGLQSLEHL